MTVLPVINAEPGDDDTVARQVAAVREGASGFHIDVSDGTFAPHETWRDAAAWPAIGGGLPLQAHLMVRDPEAILPAWLDAGADEVVVHLEVLGAAADARLDAMRARCAASGAELILAGGPSVSAEDLSRHGAHADGYLVLAVEPGPAGQGMHPEALDVVRALRAADADAIVYVDGGVDAGTVGAVRDAGASGAVAAHAIFGADDPASALAALQSE